MDRTARKAFRADLYAGINRQGLVKLARERGGELAGLADELETDRA